MDTMTLEEFREIPDGAVFATGGIPDTPDGLYMTGSGRILLYVAKKGYNQDWALYCGFKAFNDFETIESNGDKVGGEENIRRVIPCMDDVFARYRY
jgi:hypothetical protein